MTKLNIGVIFGGKSSEHEVSCASAASIISNIDTEKFDVTKIWIDKKGVWFVYNGPIEYLENSLIQNHPADAEFIPAVLSPCSVTGGLFILDKENCKYSVLKLDCIIPIIHGATGEDGVLQGLLELSHIPYVGCKTASSAVCMDKALTKIVLDSKGIKQADWLMFYKSQIQNDMQNVIQKICSKFEFPVFVKPANTGSSVGITKAYNCSELSQGLTVASDYDEKIIVEEFIQGREIEVAILETINDNKAETVVSCCGEVKPGSDFYDYNDKYINGSSYTVIPADIDEKISSELGRTAKLIFEYLECRGFARCDFFLRGEQIIFNEVNTLPGFTKISMYPRLINHSGINYTELITKLIQFAMQTKQND